MSLTSSLFSNGGSSNKIGTLASSSFIKLQPLPKDESMFNIWKLKVEATIRGCGLNDVLNYSNTSVVKGLMSVLQKQTLDKLNQYRAEREASSTENKESKQEQLTQEQKDIIENQSYKVYSALADTLTTADQLRILLNKQEVPEGDANRLWLAIKARYDIQGTDATKERLWEIFNGIKMKNEEDFKTYKGRVEEAVANLCTIQEAVPESRIKAKLIAGLTWRYSPFVGALYASDHTHITTAQLCKNINDYEESNVFRSHGIEVEEEKQGFAAMVKDDKKKVNDHKKKKECYHCHKTGHFAADCYKNKNKDKKCNKCHKVGHVEADCYTNTKKKCNKCYKVGHNTNECRRNNNNNNSSNHHNRNNNTSNYKNNKNDDDNNDQETEYGNYFLPVINEPINSNTWILDSGASKHVCTNKEIMNNMQPLPTAITIKCANKQAVQLKETGRVRLNLINSAREIFVTFKEVAYAPTFQCNILSVGMLVKAGLKVVFGDTGAMAIDNKGTVIITAKKFGNLFIVTLVKPVEYANAVTEEKPEEQPELWHQRLGHMSYHGIKKVISVNSVNGLPLKEMSINMLKCSDCMNGKQHRHAFNHEWNDKAEEVMDRVHADTVGPMEEDRAGNRYSSMLIDEKSRQLFVELVAKKSDIASGIMKWCNSAKTYQQKTLIEFHVDGGGEYKGKELKQYFENEGIHVTTTLPSTPQHNSIVERINRTIFESARSMLSHASLPRIFWGDAVLYAVHIRNRCALVTKDNKSPYELWSKKKPSVAHIRVFGCDAFMHVKDADRTKLDFKSIQCIMIGYSEVNRGYKLYSIVKQKVLLSRDVEFNEQEFKHCALLKEKLKTNDNRIGNPIQDDNYFKILEADRINNNNIIEGIDPEVVISDVESSQNDAVNQHVDKEAERKEEQFSEPSSDEKEVQLDEVNEDEEEDEAKEEAPAVSRRRRNELDMLNAGNHHPMFASTRNSRREKAVVDRGAVITDNNQLDDYAEVLIESSNSDNASEYCFMNTIVEPTSFSEAMNSENAEEWKRASDKEFKSLIDNKTWIKCKLPEGRKAIGCKWVFKVKVNKSGEVERYKARLVAKGYSQKEGIDYKETFAPVLKYKSLRILLAIAAIKDLEVKQMDVETAFLNATMKEEVYMEQPEGFHDGHKNNVLKLEKTLYGTKQAPHEWNNTLNTVLLTLKYVRCLSDTCTYVKMSRKGLPIIIAVFVDDILILFHKQDEAEWLSDKQKFMNEFKTKDMDDAEWILGIRVIRDRDRKIIKLDHEVQIDKTLSTFGMSDCNPVSIPYDKNKFSITQCPTTQEEKYSMEKIPYKSIVGALQYISLSIRPDISYIVNQLSRYLVNPGEIHWIAAKRVLRYLKGTKEMSLLFKDNSNDDADPTMNCNNINVEVFCDADFGGDIDDRKSTTGVIIKINNNTIIWFSKKQSTVSLSTAEAEYIAIATATQELLWINQYLIEIGYKEKNSIPIIRTDNQAAKQIASNDTLHSRSKHIDIRYHFIRQLVQEQQVKIEYISTKEQQGDINTKRLDVSSFRRLRNKIMSQR